MEGGGGGLRGGKVLGGQKEGAKRDTTEPGIANGKVKLQSINT